jgi:hypothetical protein
MTPEERMDRLEKIVALLAHAYATHSHHNEYSRPGLDYELHKLMREIKAEQHLPYWV